MEQIKVLNLYAGIGGNRKLWENVQVTAVEMDPAIAQVYAYFYPDDEVIVGDAHDYLLKNYDRFDYIWSSPPCPSHSQIRRCGVQRGQYPAVYPDISLWEEIILLKHFAPRECRWTIENVIPYYNPIVEPSFQLDRHFFWSNFSVYPKSFAGREVIHTHINGSKHKIYGFDISRFPLHDKRRILRNLVDPKVGQYIFETAMQQHSVKEKQLGLFA